MKKLFLLVSIVLAIVGLFPRTAIAATSVYISPSSNTITVGENVTVSVVITSGSDEFSTAEARINFNSSILQFVGYAGGSLSEAATSSSSSSFKYSGFKLPPLLSGTKTMYTITFKGIGAGTASLSLSEVLVLNGGTTLASSGSGGSITVNAASSGGSSGSGGGSASTKKTATPTQTPVGDKTAPTLTAEPTFDKSQSVINMKFNSSETATAKVTYYREGIEKKTLESSPKSDHEIAIGKDDPLTPGFTYKIELVLTDDAGNVSSVQSWDVRTTGVTYTVRLLDKNGSPVANQPVQLFSDPISGTTDNNGYVTFNDVPVGEHTLVTEIDGVTLRKPVTVGIPVDGESSEAALVSVPIVLAATSMSEVTKNNWLPWLILGLVVGALSARLPLRTILNSLTARRKKPKNTGISTAN